MPRRLAAVVILIGVSIFINYIDRGNLSTAATLVKNELHLSATQLGFLLTAFFITYMPMQPVVGWLVDRFTASRVLVAGFVVWSLATTLSGFAEGFTALFACRLILGLGESVSFPSAAKILAENVPEAQRGLANGIVQSGLAFGPAFGVLFGGMLIAAFGWRPFFIGFGLVSLLWIGAWMAFAARNVRHSDASQAPDAPATALVLRQPSLWGASLAQFCSNFLLYFILTWIPYYLVNERHWSLRQMALIAGTSYLLTGISMVAGGAIADRFIRRGASPTFVRKATFGVGAVGAAIGMIGCGYSSDISSAAWLMFAGAAGGLLGMNIFVAAQTMAGPAATARWVGVQNMLGNVAGIVAPSLTGILVDRTGSFTLPFTIAALMALSSGAAWIFLVGPMVPIDWSCRKSLAAEAA
ncbi:MAG TPA: MFS transporter [Candidatus Cybelea sp.]|jgi:MFS family permease